MSAQQSPALTQHQVRNWHRSIIALFVFLGAAWAALLTRMPLVKADLQVTATQLGLILLGSGIGSLISLNLVGRMVAARGTRRWIRLFYPILALLVIANTLMIETHQTIAFLVGAILMGSVMGIADASINIDGTALERITGRNLMPRMHAGYSIGTMVGSGWGIVAAAGNFSLLATTLPLALVAIALPTVVAKHLPAGTGIEDRATKDQTLAKPAHWFSFTLILFGLGILGLTVSEGAAGDWMTLGFTQGYGASGADAGIGFFLFFGGMVLVRFFGGHLADRLGKGRALQLLAAIGVAGVLLVILGAQSLYLGWLGAILWGAGVALGFPLFLSAAGEGENSAKRVSFVASWGYGAFLAGPPILGIIADHIGMLHMFYVIAGFMVVALLVAGAAGRKRA